MINSDCCNFLLRLRKVWKWELMRTVVEKFDNWFCDLENYSWYHCKFIDIACRLQFCALIECARFASFYEGKESFKCEISFNRIKFFSLRSDRRIVIYVQQEIRWFRIQMHGFCVSAEYMAASFPVFAVRWLVHKSPWIYGYSRLHRSADGFDIVALAALYHLHCFEKTNLVIIPKFACQRSIPLSKINPKLAEPVIRSAHSCWHK